MAYNKEQEEQKAIDEALALSKVGKRERPRRLRFETGNHNKSKFDKLFINESED